MGHREECVRVFEETKRTASGASTWKLRVWLNWARFRLKRTRRECFRIVALVVENELNHRPESVALGQRVRS